MRNLEDDGERADNNLWARVRMQAWGDKGWGEIYADDFTDESCESRKGDILVGSITHGVKLVNRDVDVPGELGDVGLNVGLGGVGIGRGCIFGYKLYKVKGRQ
jgi:hypothetical protein